MGAMCQQKQYAQLNYNSSHRFQQSIKKMEQKKVADSIKFEESIKKMQQKKANEDKKFLQSIKKMEEKKAKQDEKFLQSLKKFETKKKKQPNQTQMAKLLYGYMRLYGSNPDYNKDIGKFIQQNYNSNYCSYTYKLGSSTPNTTYKNQVVDRFKTAHQNGLISDHQVFTKADEGNRKIWYTWTVRKQITNHRTLYQCEAEFDQENKFLKLTLRETDTYNYRPPPRAPQPQKKQKYSWQSPSKNNYVGQSTDWGAYYNAQTQRSNEQFRQNMNKQAQQWNNYAQQKNARGW